MLNNRASMDGTIFCYTCTKCIMWKYLQLIALERGVQDDKSRLSKPANSEPQHTYTYI